MTVSSAGVRPKSDCSGKAQKQLYSKLQTHPLVREGATKYQTRTCLKEISRKKKNWSRVPDGRLTPRQTGRQTVCRKLTSTSDQFSWWQLLGYWIIGDLELSSLWDKSCCRWGTGTVSEPRRRRITAVGNRYQRTDEETADQENSLCAVVNCRMCELVIAQ
jgi:hypothetical protein